MRGGTMTVQRRCRGGAGTGSTPHENDAGRQGRPERHHRAGARARGRGKEVPEAAPRAEEERAEVARALLADVASRRRGARSEEGEAARVG